MSIHEDTASFEAWLRTQCDVFEPAFQRKHDEMREKYPFFRATYYRWARHWREVCPDLQDAPPVLGLGDIHLENYGTWRDADCRLCWGVNDFDEADDLPYTHDLVRLVASTQFADKVGTRHLDLVEVCDLVLNGYRKSFRAGEEPFVLEEQHTHLRKLALRADQEPVEFWREKLELPVPKRFKMDARARAVLMKALPDAELSPDFRPRMNAGVGSLGKPRYVALAEWHGGWICREAKAMTPPATSWLDGSKSGSRLRKAVGRARRSPDPFYVPIDGWITRRLAPHCSRIELKDMKAAIVNRMLEAMGREIGNVHLGTPGAAKAIRKDLELRGGGWLVPAARAMADAVEKDWKAWKKRSNI